MADAARTGILPASVEALAVVRGGAPILDAISLSIAPRTRTVVLGANGAGKSTLLRALHGLLSPDGGRIRWNEDGIHERSERHVRRAQAMVFQRPVMLRRSALANVEFALDVAGAGSDARPRAIAALERVGLANLAHRPARLCSIGEQQRIALARAWAIRPELLFLDEPTASLDPAATRAVEDIVRAMHAAGTTIVMTTHDLGQARRLAERVLFLHRGRLVEDGPADAFFDRPASPEAAAFVRGDLLW